MWFSGHFVIIKESFSLQENGNNVRDVLPTLWIHKSFIRQMEDRRAETTKNEKMFNGWSWLKWENFILLTACYMLRIQRLAAWLLRTRGHTFLVVFYSSAHSLKHKYTGFCLFSLGQTELGRPRMCHQLTSDLCVPEGIGVSVRPRLYLSFSFLGTVYFCKGMYL